MSKDGRQRFTQEVLDRLSFVQGADIAPDGGKVVYVRFTTDPEAGKDTTSLWLLDVATGDQRRLTSGGGKDSAPAFSPDGSRVAFLSDRSEKPQIYVIPVDGGEASALTSLPRGVSGPPAWSPQGEQIAFAAGPQGEARDPEKAYRVTRAVYRFDGAGYIDDIKQDIYLVPAGGGDARRLTDDARNNHSPVWAPDGQSLIYSTGMDPDDLFPWTRLGRVDLTGAVTTVPQPQGLVTSAGFAPDGRLAFVTVMHSDRPVGSKSELYVVDPGSGEVRLRTGTLHGQVGAGIGGDTPAMVTPSSRVRFLGDRAVLQVQVGGTANLHAIALSGPEEFTPLTSGDRNCTPLAIAGERVVFLASDVNQPADLHLLEGGRERRLTELNRDVLKDVDLPRVQKVAATGSDGVAVEGWFLEPTGGARPHPTVLEIHGGPHGAYGHTFHAGMQLLAGAGYGVLFVNHRGSTGYGDEFANKIVGDWGNHDYGDLMAGVDRAIEMGLADPGRLGVCGISGGGNLSSWVVGHTDRFKAAVPQNPVTNHLSEFGVADCGLWFLPVEMGGPPHEMLHAYLRMSPVTYAHRCTTPTLLIQSELDMRCPPEQSEQFYAALKFAGCPAEMLRMPGVPHAGSVVGPLAIRRAENEALLEWMNRWILGERPGEQAPEIGELVVTEGA